MVSPTKKDWEEFLSFFWDTAKEWPLAVKVFSPDGEALLVPCRPENGHLVIPDDWVERVKPLLEPKP